MSTEAVYMRYKSYLITLTQEQFDTAMNYIENNLDCNLADIKTAVG